MCPLSYKDQMRQYVTRMMFWKKQSFMAARTIDIRDMITTARIRYCILNARLVLIRVIAKIKVKTPKSLIIGENEGNPITFAAHSHPARKPKMYITTARAWEKKSGTPMAPPTSSPNDCEIMENAPPGPTLILVTNDDMDNPVQLVMAKDNPMISQAPARPALPTIQPSRKKRITPRIVSRVGVNTPPKVPYFTDCWASCSSVCC